MKISKKTKLRIASELAEAVKALCQEPGMVMLAVNGEHMTITDNTFNGEEMRNMVTDAAGANETYKERLLTIRSISEALCKICLEPATVYVK